MPYTTSHRATKMCGKKKQGKGMQRNAMQDERLPLVYLSEKIGEMYKKA